MDNEASAAALTKKQNQVMENFLEATAEHHAPWEVGGWRIGDAVRGQDGRQGIVAFLHHSNNEAQVEWHDGDICFHQGSDLQFLEEAPKELISVLRQREHNRRLAVGKPGLPPDLGVRLWPGGRPRPER